MRLTIRTALATAAAVVGFTATAVAPADASVGFDHCPVGKFCVFDHADNQAPMDAYAGPQASAEPWDDEAPAVYNRSGGDFSCMWSPAEFQYLDPGRDMYVRDPGIGTAPPKPAPPHGAKPRKDENSSFRWGRTLRECQSGKEYSDWNSGDGEDAKALPFGDLNGDGQADLLQRNWNGSLYFLDGDGNGTYLGRGWNGMTLARHGDLTGDGKEDLLARDKAGVLWLYPGTGDGRLGKRSRVGAGWSGMRRFAPVGDLDGDGRDDLMALDKSGHAWLYPGNGHGGFGHRRSLGAGWGSALTFTGTGDLDGDGHGDVVASDTAGRLWRYPGNGHGGFGHRVLIGSGGWQKYPTLLCVGDVLDDLAWNAPDLLAKSDRELTTYPGTGKGTLGDGHEDWNWAMSDIF
ncbi:FG-GAP repeat domain-containing protein [Streptomyces sp. NPDC050516]|uniref:FG-GAP repeat domain-containing protein n=1 Tax=Streptomyces sp. NPDC050516 TaxID=3365621 RepID=UPI0037A5C29F